MSGTLFHIVIVVLVVVFLILLAIFERMGESKGKRNTEEKAMMLLHKVEGLVEEGKTKKALRLLADILCMRLKSVI